MFGTGYSRGFPYQLGDPGKAPGMVHPFLYASHINGVAISSSKFVKGYVIGQSSVDVGLTPTNMQ